MVELTPFVVTGLALCFLWSGFIRSGLGFGGLVLTLPFALMVVDSPLDIMPLAIVHAFVVGGENGPHVPDSAAARPDL